jgi:hypothetical protein
MSGSGTKTIILLFAASAIIHIGLLLLFAL